MKSSNTNLTTWLLRPTHHCILKRYEISIPHGALVHLIKCWRKRKCAMLMVNPSRDRNGQRVVVTQLNYFRKVKDVVKD